jgi:hypothetical protein
MKTSNAQQAVLITAYKNIEQIYDIINFLGDGFEFYIHIDKKSSLDISMLENTRNEYLFKEYIVNWGSVNHLKSILFLAEKALKNKNNYFFHLISGQDFPAKSPGYFFNELDTTKDYLSFSEMSNIGWTNGGMERIEYYNLYEYFDYKKKVGRAIIRLLVEIQKKLRMKRKVPYTIFPKLYGGPTWWSLTRKSLQHVIDFTNTHKLALKSMRFTFCSEEIYFQTILLNSEYAKNIVNDYLRYIDWSSGRGGYPAFLDITDYEKIKESNNLFARKFHEREAKEFRYFLTNGTVSI